jgi:hypothetical protein
MKLTLGYPAEAAVWKTLLTTSAGTSRSTCKITTPGNLASLMGLIFSQSFFAPCRYL